MDEKEKEHLEDRRIERLVVLISHRERVAFDDLSAKERRSKSELIRMALEKTYPDSFGAKAKAKAKAK